LSPDKISIIIPVYNVEPYIRRCLDSVIHQTYTNLEILCINDGSTDLSGKICEEYAARDKRIKVFHKKNGGLPSARNEGIKNITGKYVGFVDSDDWIEPEMYEILYKLVKSKNVLVSAVNFFTATDTYSTPRKNTRIIPERRLSQEDMLLYIYRLDLYNGFHVTVWNKLFSAELFSCGKLNFDETLTAAGEDVLFTAQAFMTKNCTGAYSDKALYHYYQRDTSLVHSSKLNSFIYNGSLKAHKMVEDLFSKNGYDDFAMLAKKEICYYASYIADLAIKSGDKKVLSFMQKEMRDYLSAYTEVYSEYPERIERINKLIELEPVNINGMREF